MGSTLDSWRFIRTRRLFLEVIFKVHIKCVNVARLYLCKLQYCSTRADLNQDQITVYNSRSPALGKNLKCHDPVMQHTNSGCFGGNIGAGDGQLDTARALVRNGSYLQEACLQPVSALPVFPIIKPRFPPHLCYVL